MPVLPLDSHPPAHGGPLVDLIAPPDRRAELVAESRDWPSWDLTARQLCDLELLLCGAFSPLTGFLTSTELASVSAHMRLPSGTLWPMPITLDLDEKTAARLAPGRPLALRDPEGTMLGALW